MALYYHTEYRLGNRRRICRSYTGFQAFMAIGFDLVFGILFELVFSLLGSAAKIAVLTARFVDRVLRIHCRILVAARTPVVYVVTLPLMWVHQAVDRLRPRGEDERADPWRRPDAVVKPSWALSPEV